MAEADLRAERLKKLALLKQHGVDAYPARIPRTCSIPEFLERFSVLEKSGARESLAGRIMSVREHGGILFADLYDGTGRVQLILRRGEEIPDEDFDLFHGSVDQGDFISATGSALTTKRGERSLGVHGWVMAAKSLLPLPSEWYGLKDEDARYRDRYLDLILNADLHAMFLRRASFWRTIRTFLESRGFIEVETPVLETEPGGADARPFITRHNALDMDVYLRISAGELWQKRLLIGGFPKVFEIGRIFRNEGISFEHGQDYTQLEFYQAYADYEEGMELIQDLYRAIAREVYGKSRFTIKSHEIDLDREWERIDFVDVVQRRFGIDAIACTVEDALESARESDITIEKDAAHNKARIIDTLWKHARREIAGPAFLVGIPVYLEPLAKRDSRNPALVERCQVILAGSEIGKGYSELNDPRDQRIRLEEQQRLREAGDEEAQRLDADYLRAMEYGMPPAFGFGVSERLFSFLENVSLREGQLFPLMRKKEERS